MLSFSNKIIKIENIYIYIYNYISYIKYLNRNMKRSDLFNEQLNIEFETLLSKFYKYLPKNLM